MDLLLADSALMFAGFVTGLLTGAVVRVRVLGWIAGAGVSIVYGLVIGLAMFVGDSLSAWLLVASFAAGCAAVVYRMYIPAPVERQAAVRQPFLAPVVRAPLRAAYVERRRSAVHAGATGSSSIRR